LECVSLGGYHADLGLARGNAQARHIFWQKPPFSKSIIRAAKTYHGYYFSWTIIYTVWYHPTEATWGHLMAFSYIVVLLLQGSPFYYPISPQS